MEQNIKSKLREVYKKAMAYLCEKTAQYMLILTACMMFIGFWSTFMSYVVSKTTQNMNNSTGENKELNKESFRWIVLFSICSSLFHHFVVTIILVSMYPKSNKVKPLVNVSLKCTIGNMLTMIIFIITGVHSIVKSAGFSVILGHVFSVCVWMFITIRLIELMESKDEQDEEEDEEEVEEDDEPELCDQCRSKVDVC